MSDIPSGWPCAGLPVAPPSVVDLEAQPTADDLLPAVLALAPRGAAWGTDEVGDGRGASPVQLGFWRGIAAWVADHLGRDWQAATQAFPSAITYTLPDWENELGLPGPCNSALGGDQARVAAVRARFAAQGGASPAYFTCLAAAAGFDITIEEPTQFMVDTSSPVGGDPVEVWFEASAVATDGGSPDTGSVTETWFVPDDGACDDTVVEGYVLPALGDGDPIEAVVLAPDPDPSDADDEVAGGIIESWFVPDDGACDDTAIESFAWDPNGTTWRFWVVHVTSLAETWFQADEGEADYDPVEGFLPASDLECLIRTLAPPHTQCVFSYQLAAT